MKGFHAKQFPKKKNNNVNGSFRTLQLSLSIFGVETVTNLIVRSSTAFPSSRSRPLIHPACPSVKDEIFESLKTGHDRNWKQFGAIKIILFPAYRTTHVY